MKFMLIFAFVCFLSAGKVLSVDGNLVAILFGWETPPAIAYKTKFCFPFYLAFSYS